MEDGKRGKLFQDQDVLYVAEALEREYYVS